MRNSRTYHRLIFTFGVLVFLLRPFLGYLMIGAGGTAGDPLRTSQLTQRLIKKKDEHHEPGVEAIEEIGSRRYARPLPVRLFRHLYRQFLSQQSKARFYTFFTSCIFKIVPNNHFYRSHSSFRI